MQVKNSYPTVLTDLIGFDPRRLKGLKGDELSRNGPSCLCEIFFFFFSVKQKWAHVSQTLPYSTQTVIFFKNDPTRPNPEYRYKPCPTRRAHTSSTSSCQSINQSINQFIINCAQWDKEM